MPWAAAAAIGGAIITSSASKSAAKGQQEATTEAARLNAEATDKTLALQREQFNRTLELAQPAIQAGNAARNRLTYLTGLSPTGYSGGSAQPVTAGGAPAPAPAAAGPAQLTREQILAELQPQFTAQGAATAQPTMQERPDLYQVQGNGSDGSGAVYVGPAVNANPQVDTTALNAAVEARLAQQTEAQTAARAAQEKEQARVTTAAQADPAYGSLMRNFSAADMAADPLYERDAVAAARARSAGADPYYEMLKPAIGNALERITDPSKDTYTQRMQPGIDLALGRIADPSTDTQTQQLKPLIDAAIARSTNFQTAPGYEFRRAEGQKGVENSAAARGGIYSGAALKALDRYNQDYASNEYGNWFNQSAQDRSFVQGAGTDAYNRLNTDRNFVSGQNDAQYGRMNTDRNFVQGANNDAFGRMNTDRQYVANQGDASFNRFNTQGTNQFNRLASITGAGQTATGNVTTAGQNYASGAGAAYTGYAGNVGNLVTNNANAQGAAQIAGANAVGNAATNAASAYQQNQFAQQLKRNQLQTFNGYGTSYGSYTPGQNSFYFGNGTSGD